MLKILISFILISFLFSCQPLRLRKRHTNRNSSAQLNKENNWKKENTEENIKFTKDKKEKNIVFFKKEESDKRDKSTLDNRVKNEKRENIEKNKKEIDIERKNIERDKKDINIERKKIEAININSKEDLENTKLKNKELKIKKEEKKDIKSEKKELNSIIKEYKDEVVKTPQKKVILKSDKIDMSKKVSIDKRAVTLRIDTVTNWIMPNDRVDVIGIFNNRNNRKVATTLVENILVLAIGNDTTETLSKKKRKIYYNNITLSLSLKEAEVLILAQEQGKIYFVLRNDNNNKKDGNGKKIIIKK